MKIITIPIEWLAELLLELPTDPLIGHTKRIDGSWAEPRGLECREVRATLGELLKRIDPDEEHFHVEQSGLSPVAQTVWSPYWWRLSTDRQQRQQAYSEAERQERAFYAEQQANLFNAIATRMSLDLKKDRQLLQALCNRMLTMMKETPELAKQFCKSVYGFELQDYVKPNQE